MPTSYNVVALVSGGKDSIMSMMRCVDEGHRIVALANLYPDKDENDELDSYMYQTVGHEGVEAVAHCMQLPMFRRAVKGGCSLSTELEYQVTHGDEVEDLYELLKHIKYLLPDVNAVSSGAILSNYQRTRVESVCMRLGLVSLAFLWQCNQGDLLDNMIDSGLHAILIKVACLGLSDHHLGKNLEEVRPVLHRLNREFGCHICGEGGEFESFTLDCPLYKQRIVIDSAEIVKHQDDPVAPVAYLRLRSYHMESKLAPCPLTSSPSQTTTSSLQRASIHFVRTQSSAPSAIGTDQQVEYPQLRREESAKPAPCALPSASESLLEVVGACCTCRVYSAGNLAHIPAADTVEEQADALLAQLEDELQRDLGKPGPDVWSEVAQVGVYLRDIMDFAELNRVYSKRLPLRCPPTRLCVGLPLPDGARVKFDCLVAPARTKDTLHVQSQSGWAPCNIGPYSQAKKLGWVGIGLVLVSGQIGLDPASMMLVKPSGLDSSLAAPASVPALAAVETEQCVRNLRAILLACGASLAGSLRLTVFIAQAAAAGEALRALGAAGLADSAGLVLVAALPRGALVELHLAAALAESSGPGGSGPVDIDVADVEGLRVACLGKAGGVCAANCLVKGGTAEEGDDADWKSLGKKLGLGARRCLQACQMSAADLVSLRVFFRVKASRPYDALDQAAAVKGLADGLYSGMDSGMRVGVSYLPALGVGLGDESLEGLAVLEMLAATDRHSPEDD